MILFRLKCSSGFSVLKELTGPEKGLIDIGDIDRGADGKFTYIPDENFNYLTYAQQTAIEKTLLILNEPSSLSSNFPS
ncbi:hypothetical protein LCGC14_1961460 [marine sediment metagenome]|uniref:Uncharacterized protein n=1 Tax=marine sediment metagenome TaxID=412755 RepID=A0A0F9IBN0_9ZZZZ